MAEAPAVTDISNCTICLGGLIEPRILPCSHFFCENCLSEHITSTVTEPGQNVYNCPVCRRSVETEDPTMEKSRWVSFLPMKVTPDVPITFKESKTQHCHPCERRKIKVNANMWCSECSEAFCHSCSDVHCNMKISSSHQTISITNEDLDEKFDKLFLATGVVEHGEFCSIHNGRRIEMYCKDHGQAICIQCLSSDHRKCEKLEMIDTLDDLKDESLNTFKSELGKLLNAVKTLAEEKTENKRAIQTMFTSIESQSLATITELKMKLDDLYIEFLKKAGIQQDELQSELDQTLKTLSKYSVVLEEKIRNVELVTRFGSKVQALRVTNAIKCEMGKIGENLFPMLLKSTEYKARGNFDTIVNTLNNITELGSISISKNNKESTCSGDIRKFQDLLVTDSRVEFCNVSLVLNSILECPHKTIKSSVYLDKETCAVLTIDKLLQIGLYTNEILNSESVNSESKKLCFDPDKNILFGTLYNASGIYCTVKGKQLVKNKNFKFGEMVCGVDICEGNLYIITEKAILQSQDIKNIQTSISGYRDDISFDAKSKRFSFMIFEGKILFANMSDKSVRHYQGDFKINKPQSIAFGPSGMLFVADSPNLIHVISPDEKSVRALLPKLQKIKTVSDITVSHDKKKLLISGGSYVEIYDIVNEKF